MSEKAIVRQAVSLALEAGRRDYVEKGFEDNPYSRRSQNWRDWNTGWRAAQLADPLLDEDEKNAGI